MAIYEERDIASTFNGDIKISSNGDLALAESIDTIKSAVNFLLRTDYGDYQPNTTVGSNLGYYIGETNNPSTHSKMEYSINKALKNGVMASNDVSCDVVAFDINEALAIVNIAGTFLISGSYVAVEEDRIMYSFPYIDGRPTPLTI